MKVVLAIPVLDLKRDVKGIIVIDAQKEEGMREINWSEILDKADNLSIMLEPML